MADESRHTVDGIRADIDELIHNESSLKSTQGLDSHKGNTLRPKSEDLQKIEPGQLGGLGQEETKKERKPKQK